MELMAIDAHVHCGRQFCDPPQDLEDYAALIGDCPITGAVMFPPVMEIYDRHNPDFQDNEYWRERRLKANRYLLELGREDFEVIPYLFLWNDFRTDELTARHKGIKWHRHPDEPGYHYEDPSCRAAIEEIRSRNMPVCLEEELENTLLFLDELAPGVRVIIPHCGRLNGGYEELKRLRIWERPNVYTDTSPSSTTADMVEDYVEHYGYERIMFGSDFPFGIPSKNYHEVLELNVPDEAKEAILIKNIRRLLRDSNV